MSTPTAYWSTDQLVTSLKNHGWGELDGRNLQGARNVLGALVALTDHTTGDGKVTRGQVADVACLSPRWVGRCMGILEELGLITWDRGGVRDGRPVPGWVRINKRRLADMAKRARGYLRTRRAQRADETRKRIAETLRLSTFKNVRKRKSPSESMGNSVPPFSPSENKPRRATRRPGLVSVENSPATERTTPVSQRPLLHAIPDHPTDEQERILYEPQIPPHERPKGDCGTCSLTFAQHVKVNLAAPLDARHLFEVRR